MLSSASGLNHFCLTLRFAVILLQNDYLSHLTLYAALAEAARNFKNGEPFALLDLGCGTASHVADALKLRGAGARLSRHMGVDLAAESLKASAASQAENDVTTLLRMMT